MASPGRPKKPKAEVRTNVLRILLTDAERKALDAEAAGRALETSTWARAELLQIAKGRQAGLTAKPRAT